MSLSQAISTSRRLMRRNARDTAILNIENLARHALVRMRTPLARKNQVGSIVCDQNVTSAHMAFEPLLTTLQDAILEISALAARDSIIVIGCRNNLLQVNGSNPIELPDGGLATDHDFRMQAYLQRIQATLCWDQGIGPTLRLSLPSGDFRTPTLRLARNSTDSSSGTSGGGDDTSA